MSELKGVVVGLTKYSFGMEHRYPGANGWRIYDDLLVVHTSSDETEIEVATYAPGEWSYVRYAVETE